MLISGAQSPAEEEEEGGCHMTTLPVLCASYIICSNNTLCKLWSSLCSGSLHLPCLQFPGTSSRMGPVRYLLLAAVCMQVSSMPLSSHLSEEEEKVTRCIMEVLAESLSTQGSERVSSGCIRLLREDERLIAILRHQHLLRELEDLSHREKSEQHEEQESSEEEELKKRNSQSPAPATKRENESKRGHENEESKEFEKIEKVEMKEKEHGTSAEEKAQELLEEEENKRSPATKRDDSEGKRAEKKADGATATKQKQKKEYSDESNEDSSEEEEHGRGLHGNREGWYHRNHEEWEERKRASERRMAEDPRQEETAQFENENKGMKYYNTKSHMQGFHGEEKRHMHHPEEEDMGRERNFYGQDEDELERERYHHERPGNHEHREEEEERELEEMEEREEHRAEEHDIQAVEEELRKAAQRLQEIHRG